MTAMKNMLTLEDGENVHLVEIEELEVADRQNYILNFIKDLDSEGVAFENILENKRKRVFAIAHSVLKGDVVYYCLVLINPLSILFNNPNIFNKTCTNGFVHLHN